MKLEKIAFIVAMRSEAKSLISAMKLNPAADILPDAVPFETYTGAYAGKQILVTVGGVDSDHGVDNVASQPAALMTWLTVERFKPDLLINAGTAGGMQALGCEIGNVYLSKDAFRFHDRRIPLPRFREYGIGSYPSVNTDELAGALGLKQGVISTGDSLDMTEKDLEMIRSNGAAIKEMEAAAVAWVCRLTNTPMLAVKAITDLIDGETPPEKQFAANLRMAVDNLRQAVEKIVKYL